MALKKKASIRREKTLVRSYFDASARKPSSKAGGKAKANANALQAPDPARRVAEGVHLTGRTRATRGSKRHGGMTGHCFLIKGGIHTKGGFPLFDTNYQSWYGDDDFAFRVEKFGYQIHCVEGLPCDHLNEATMRHRPDLVQQREADRQRFVAAWGAI